jgi:hypothetical protein
MVWEVKDTKGPPLLVLHAFYEQRVLMALQHVQAISILRCVVIIGEGSFRLSVFLGSLPLSLFHMLLATKGGLGT